MLAKNTIKEDNIQNILTISNLKKIKSGTERVIKIPNYKEYKTFQLNNDIPVEFRLDTKKFNKKLNKKLNKFLIPTIHLTKRIIKGFNENKTFDQTDQSDQMEKMKMEKLKQDIIKQSRRKETNR